METLYAGEEEAEAAGERRLEISIQPWADVGAPQVGFDEKADAWALKHLHREPGEDDEALLRNAKGHYALALVRETCDGIPSFTHAGLYGEVDETSFRGAFLEFCEDILGEELLVTAWTPCMTPEEAVAYGTALLAAADRAAAPRDSSLRGAFRKLFGSREKPTAQQTTGDGEMTLDEKIDVLRTAGRWYIFWGRKGHPIAAWS